MPANIMLNKFSNRGSEVFRNTLTKMKLLFPVLLAWVLAGCNKKQFADTIIYNAKIYTADATFSIAEAMSIKDEKIIAVGSSKELLKKYSSKQEIDAGNKTVYPGFIDAHTHFLGYGLQLNNINLVGTKSWDEILQRVETFSRDKAPGKWLVGRGWDQNDWENKNFPDKTALDLNYPNTPVLLTRIDGHAAIANAKALDLAKIKPNMKLDGGTIETINGKLTGILVDNAVDLVKEQIPEPTNSDKEQGLLAAEKLCFEQGLTTVDDCGMDFEEVELIQSLYRQKRLKMKMYILLHDKNKNYTYLFRKGKIQTKQLTVTGFKIYGDGALGSRGACLRQPYHDKPGEGGFLLSTLSHFDSVAKIIYNHQLQMCTHAIGDSANRTILKIYGKYLQGKNDFRWRIEHAQVVAPGDFELFKKYSIIPSVQPTHATSDMYWAGERLGAERLQTAYAYKQLLEQNNWMPLGTDFPVEDISPLKTFFAAVYRKDSNHFPANGFQPENALTRAEALRGMTIWAAKSNFEENKKGSLETGKFADFIILNNDIMTCSEKDILQTKVLQTWSNGKLVFAVKN
jgi:predicted amidohydrolase YtcJ